MEPNLFLVGCSFLLGENIAAAQTRGPDSGASPNVALTPAHKQACYQNISTTGKNNPRALGFRTAAGASMTDAVLRAPMAEAPAGAVLQTTGLEAVQIEGPAVQVNRQNKQGFALLVQEQKP
jgi:hypothetical protein